MASTVEQLPQETNEYRLAVPLLTARLALRPFQDSDVGGLTGVLTDQEVARYIGGAKSVDESRESLYRMRDAFCGRGWGTLAVILRESQSCIGYCGVRPLLHTNDVELAFALSRSCWNQGLATEAAIACVSASFRDLCLDSIVATVYEENRASRRVLEKIGMRLEQSVFGSWPRDRALLYRLRRTV
jgi:RimJ/RimL family protein N-acetyltransferase